MGFKKELISIFGPTRGRRSAWLFSATFPDSIHALVKGATPLFPAAYFAAYFAEATKARKARKATKGRPVWLPAP